jgi:hypothetical protein
MWDITTRDAWGNLNDRYAMSDLLEVFFDACDHEMEHFMSPDAFEQGFVRAILLHGDIVIPDNALYTS